MLKLSDAVVLLTMALLPAFTKNHACQQASDLVIDRFQCHNWLCYVVFVC